MSTTYDPTLATEKDWVRFQAGDTDMTKARLQDEEIVALIADQGNKELAAAECIEGLLALAGGVSSKTVDGVTVTLGDAETSSYRAKAKRLRIEGARKLAGTSGAFMVL